ncbi:hypothetical protein Poly51_06300 [Rubripirellula tenax]|uniref:Uncharacterized protein n=1 Tax=Rubripirellula tenax TaxID=2528015 RepID=A0A5C6FHS1_9BACT|nr:hypothetical protein [Rubripirellula tenax]TWU60355.1 hypothetical protein Poly51_06300 [Rubripirellula tenax]
MKIHHSLLPLLLMLCVGCGESKPEATLSLGMTETDAVTQLKLVGATDISDGMQTAIPYTGDAVADTPAANSSSWRMWSIDTPDASIETAFEHGKLTQLNYWDWRNRKMTSYHHTMEYDELSSLTINPKDNDFTATVVQTHNANDG